MSSTCAVCRSSPVYQHTCRLRAGAHQTSGGFLARLVGAAHFAAALYDRAGTVWLCAHKHHDAAEANSCAQAQVRLLQDGSVDTSKLPRPQMKQPAETVTAHASIPGLSDAAWRNLIDVFGGKCRYCGNTGPLERNHRVPMSRNGENRIRNIVPACPLCNRAKGSATEEEYLAELRRLWGRRVPRTLARLDERLKSIEPKLQHGGMTEPRSVTLLRSLHVPAEMWISLPREAHMAIHRDNQHPIAGSSFRRETLLAVLGRRDEWKGNVALVPQPDNPHGANAVAVVHPRGQLGFLPAPVAAEVSWDLCKELREGRAVAARCVVFRTPRGIGGRVKLDVPLETRVP